MLVRLSSPVLVGRERELELLLDAVSHPPAVAFVEGEAGVGKTRLVRELLARPELRPRHRCVGACQQLSEPFPLGPVVEALREAKPPTGRLSPVTGALRPLLPELAAYLPPPPDPLGDRRAERHRLFRALRELLGSLGPAVLVLEDLHWADETTVELLRFLVPQLPNQLTLVCTYRSEELPHLGLAGSLPAEIARAHVEVRTLSRADVRRLIGTILGTEDVSEEFAGYVYEASGGLPFAVEELLRLLEDGEDLIDRRGLWVRRRLERIGVPRPLRDAILERLGRLGKDARRTVQAAGVLETPATPALLAAVSSLPEARADEALAEAVGAAVLVEVAAQQYGFRHALARQAVADAIPSPLRVRLHLSAARAGGGAAQAAGTARPPLPRSGRDQEVGALCRGGRGSRHLVRG